MRLPFFRLVQYHHIAEKGTGVIPDVYVGPNAKDIISQVDTKVEKVKELIKEGSFKSNIMSTKNNREN